MAIVETTRREPIAESDASLSSPPAKGSESPISGPGDNLTGSGPGPDGLAVEDQENAVFVSVTDREEAGTLENSAFPESGGQVEVEGCGGNEDAKRLDSGLGTRKNEEICDVKVVALDCNSGIPVEDGSDRKVEIEGNGVSDVEIGSTLGSVDTREKKKFGDEDDKASLAENAGKVCQGLSEEGGSVTKMGRRRVSGEKGSEEIEEYKDKDNTEDGEEEEEEDDDDGEDTSDEGHGYSVGDFVWGKIRSHPWWPGQIYDPSDASEHAAKYKKRNRHLVAFFGDGSFSWCSSSQLKPFAESFEEMSKQSTSKNFLNAVQKALDEIGRLLELKVTSARIGKSNQSGFDRSLASNAGIKQGVLVPDEVVSKLSIPWYEPAELVDILKLIAQVVSVSSLLELSVFKIWLSAFYRSKGGYQLAMYHEPLNVEGLGDDDRNEVDKITDLDTATETPQQHPCEEDGLSLPVVSEVGQRRKQKSVAELMQENMDVEPKDKEVTEATPSGKRKRKSTGEGESTDGSNLTPPAERKRGRKKAENLGSSDYSEKIIGEGESIDGSNLTSPGERKRRRKKAKVLGSSDYSGNRSSSSEDDSSEGKENKRGSLARKGKRSKVSGVGLNDDEAKEGTPMVSASRERKKSKYLSPPYTSPSKRDSELESVKVSKATRIGERMTRAASQVIGSPLITKCGSRTPQFSREPIAGRDSFSGASPRTHKATNIADEIKASPDEVLYKVRFVALNPLNLGGKISIDMVKGFVCNYRDSLYVDGSNYKMYHKQNSGRKRKAMSLESDELGEKLNQRNYRTPKSKSSGTGNEVGKSDISKIEEVAGESNGKRNDKKVAGNIASSVSLIVTFPKGSTLPSKNDLITTFSEFGALNEAKTDVFPKSSCARIGFLSSSDAEKAFGVSVKKSPLEAANVKFRLRYPSSAPRDRDGHGKDSSSLKEGDKTPSENQAASQLSLNEGPSLLFVRQKLEMLTSMLEKSDGQMTTEMKTNLENEMKGLLEKVSTMV